MFRLVDVLLLGEPRFEDVDRDVGAGVEQLGGAWRVEDGLDPPALRVGIALAVLVEESGPFAVAKRRGLRGGHASTGVA